MRGNLLLRKSAWWGVLEERGVDGWRVGKGRKAKVTRETQEKNERGRNVHPGGTVHGQEKCLLE